MNSPGDKNSLLRSLSAGDCIAFIGAGFTAPTGMLLWKPLLQKLIDALRDDPNRAIQEPHSLAILSHAQSCLNEGQFARAASAIRTADQSHLVDEYLDELFDANTHFHNKRKTDAGRVEMTARLEALSSLPWAGVVTTNYDTLVLDSFIHSKGCKNVCYTPSSGLGPILKSTDRPFFVHLHSNIRTRNLILTEDDYDQAYLASSPVQTFLEALFLRYTVVFIGTKVEDRFVEMRRQLQLMFGQTESPRKSQNVLPPEYVLLPSTDNDRGAYLRSTSGFRTIQYDNKTGQHEGLTPLLNELAESVAERKRRGGLLDDVCAKILKIVSEKPEGYSYSDIRTKFWASFKSSQKHPANLNDREIGYRLYFLIYQGLVALDEERDVFYSPVARRHLV